MWLEHRFDLFLTVLIFSDFIRTVICLTGDNICLEQERYVAAVRKPFKKPVHVREYKWCLQIPPRCEEDKIIYVDDYKTEDEERIRIIEKCCTGYKENTETKTCDPISCSHCVHATCNATIGKCLCDDGYIGENCDTRCSSGKWGPECALSCDCNYSTCQHTNGTCICVPGWIGERCDIPCPTGYYGENCNQKCSKCISSCDPITGECTKEKRKALENSLNNSSTEIPIKQSENSLSTIFSNDSSSNNDIRLVRTTSDVFANLSTEKPSSTQFQNRRKYFPSTSQDYVPKYIKIIQSYSSNKPIDQDVSTNRTNSSIVYIKKPIESIKKPTTAKPTDETLQQMTTINFIDIIGTTESYIPTSNDEDNLETTTENTNILSRNENDETMEMTTTNIFVNNRKSNIDDTELLDRQKSLYHSTESSTNSFSVRTNENAESQNNLPKIDSPPKADDEHENIQTTAILPEEKDDSVDLNISSSPQIPQTLPEIIVQDTKDIDSLETTETEPSDNYRTTEIMDSIQPEKTLNNQNNSHLLDTFQATETTVQTQPETTSQENQRNPVIKETYQTTEIQPEITIENQSIPVSPELTTEMRQEIEVDNQNNSDSPLMTTQTLSEIIVENMANINNFGTTKIPQIERLPETTILQMVDLNTLYPTQLPQTTEVLPKATIENMGNLNQPYSTDKAQTEIISTFKFREPATTVTTSYTTRENYVGDTVTIHGNQLEMEITSTKKLETFDENLNLSQTNLGGNSLNTIQPYFEIETNRSRFPFNNSTNIRDQSFSDVSEQDRKRTYSSYLEEMTSTTETSSTALTTTFLTKLLATATPTKTNLLDRTNEPEDILNKADNKTIIPSYEEPKTTPWYRATFMKPEVQIPININDSTLVNPTYHSITSDQNSNEMKKETDIATIPNKIFSNDGSIHNMEMTLNNDSINNTETPKIPNSSEERQDLFIKFIRTTVSPPEEQRENLWTPNNNFVATVNPNLSHQTKEQKEDWTPINFVATVNPNLPTPFEDQKEVSWTPIDFDTTIIPTASAEQQEDSWTLNNIVTENLQSPNLIEEYTPDTFFTTNSTQVDTIETRNKQESSPVIQTTTNPTNTEATII
ncbi:rhoGEF domain-containing protein gxcJ-like [Chrysoperla carnea]|uniref:rhoGEF domain-containing protein gxcJ-like n=1 Tax=Chrysoperla carnea TaxID=189513 RepID=UPI001D05FE75|nr:rhoGEF domain-containing protein gxcJ-like [Chrysoperla carnea]